MRNIGTLARWWRRSAPLLLLGVALAMAVGLVGCGAPPANAPAASPAASPDPASSPSPSPVAASVGAASPTPRPPTVPLTRPTLTPATGRPTTVPAIAVLGCESFPQGPESTKALNPNQALCKFKDAKGREIQLTAGRSSRGLDRGEFGWAHIRDKHLYGLWEAGGFNTRFVVLGATTESQVIDHIAVTVEKGNAIDDDDGTSRMYIRRIGESRYSMLVVAARESGRIITAYPTEGSRR